VVVLEEEEEEEGAPAAAAGAATAAGAVASGAGAAAASSASSGSGSGRFDWTDISSSACFHQLKVPAYSSLAVMRERLRIAVKNSAGLMDLS